MFKKVGLVGAGEMGQALLGRLRLAGIDVNVFDISETRLAEARDMGAAPVGSAAAAAEGVDVIHVFVRSDDEALAAATGESGVLAGARPGAIVILHSTILPETTQRVAEAAAKGGVRVIDAPVTAVPPRVQKGEAVFLVGGAEEDVARVRDHLLSVGNKIYHFGPLGAGNVAKLARNLTNVIERIATAEIAWIAEAGGLDTRAFLDMMKTEHTHPALQRWDSIFSIANGHVVPRPASNVYDKDVALAAKFAASRKLDTKITQGAAKTAAEWVSAWEKDQSVQ